MTHSPSGRSLRATQSGITQVKLALVNKAWSQEKLAEIVEVSRTTINKFFSGKTIDRRLFVQICQKLNLEWQTIADLQTQKISVNGVVQKIRREIAENIKERCGSMRVLDMSEPIQLEDIFTSVNILEEITGRRRLPLEEIIGRRLEEINGRRRRLETDELLRDILLKDFDRMSFSHVLESRVPGITAVTKFSKLMVLGKPGSGKTTFLKHLAIRCISGVFQPERVPIFVSLKEFAETSDQPNLLNYIVRSLPLTSTETDNFTSLQMILHDGKALILLDGLDEVRKDDDERIYKEIVNFSTQFLKNQFVITCRIAAKEYTFTQFTEVEIADFDEAQITDFTNKWFTSKNDPIKAQRFLHKLKENEPIRELATSPILLTLLCLAFEDSGSFPPNRSELYEDGLDVLLKKWDATRNIERDEIYKKLSPKRKEDLLSQIAYSTFTASNYFFKQKEAEQQITEYIKNLPDASTFPEILQLDSEAVLKSIEAQHGLFVERARHIYSFSHLTFHEYFTARQIVNSCNPNQLEDEKLQELVSHLTEKRWREVFLLTVSIL